jgi:hypothetical protein
MRRDARCRALCALLRLRRASACGVSQHTSTPHRRVGASMSVVLCKPTLVRCIAARNLALARRSAGRGTMCRHSLSARSFNYRRSMEGGFPVRSAVAWSAAGPVAEAEAPAWFSQRCTLQPPCAQSHSLQPNPSRHCADLSELRLQRRAGDRAPLAVVVVLGSAYRTWRAGAPQAQI